METETDSTVSKMKQIIDLRRKCGLPSYTRPKNTNIGFGWLELDQRGILDRWIRLLKSYKIKSPA